MTKLVLVGAAAIALVACGETSDKTPSAIAPTETETESTTSVVADEVVVEVDIDPISTALLNPDRSDEAKARDEGRKPGQIMRLAEIEPGLVVADIASSPDYYAPILASVLGSDGKLILVGPQRLSAFFPQALEAGAAYADNDDADNVESVLVNLDEFSVGQQVDRVLNILYYHDTVWTGVDRTAMNAAIFDALKPGGYYLIVDHAAKAGAGDEVTKEIHRIDPAVVRAEIEAAGFVLAKQSDLLANPDDPKEEGVFGVLRGKTDRFVYVFQKQ